MKMKMETLSIKEFVLEAPNHMVIEFLHEGEWLPVDDVYAQDESIMIDSDKRNYFIRREITIRWSVGE